MSAGNFAVQPEAVKALKAESNQHWTALRGAEDDNLVPWQLQVKRSPLGRKARLPLLAAPPPHLPTTEGYYYAPEGLEMPCC